MGSPLRLQVVSGVAVGRPADGGRAHGAPAGSAVDAAWAAVVEEFEATEQALSRFRATSEVHALRRSGGRAGTPSRRLLAALVAADRARRLTSGRFDPRIVADLERLGSAPLEIPGLPTEPPTRATGERPDPATRILRRAGRRGPIEVPLPVDFGGIGKGLALRWAARRAASLLGTLPFLLEAGGDLVGFRAPGPAGWRIGVEDPRPPSPAGTAALPGADPVAVVELPRRGGAIATSSVRRARWRGPDGRLVHHLIEPWTGEPGGVGLLAVTVQGDDPAWAEVWSKSLFLEGRRRIGALARARGLAAWWVTDDGAVEMTPAARLRTVWVAAES
jgi:thiamine biosynthesis lipoprotein